MKEQQKYPLLVDKLILKLLNTREIKNCSLNKPYQIFDGGNSTVQVILFLKVKFYHSAILITEYLNPPPKKRKTKKTTHLFVYNLFHSFCVLLYKSYLNPISLLYIDIFYVIINIVFNSYILFN